MSGQKANDVIGEVYTRLRLTNVVTQLEAKKLVVD